jgi:hypothetical protein
MRLRRRGGTRFLLPAAQILVAVRGILGAGNGGSVPPRHDAKNWVMQLCSNVTAKLLSGMDFSAQEMQTSATLCPAERRMG